MLAVDSASPTAIVGQVDPPANVWFVRATADHGPPLINVVDGITLKDGDRVAVLSGDVPQAVYEWNGTTNRFGVAMQLPGDVLVVAEEGTLRAGRAWWQKKGLTYTALVARQPHIVGKSVCTVDLSPQQSWGTTTGTWHLLVMLVRNMDGLYAPSPMATASNFYDNPRWLVPLSTSDATDRVYLEGLTDGLVGFERMMRFPVQKRKSRVSVVQNRILFLVCGRGSRSST